ncbi:TIGR00730 family Rossman fold protein [Bacillus pinisoli]|uniref:LOG family protein n=1 Tax=Bacillus pinisoli TaxID=2901866 RepID=UPI001FF48FFC|nr:TIGR00730 family Rossman fold protein [Bacillus pinisoli]
MNELKSVCVFCGSSTGAHPEYIEQAKKLGALLAEQGIELIYGGGNVGVMGEISRTVMAHGGKVTGVIPKLIHERVDHVELTNLHIVENMHERKAKMYELSDGFIALPGGIGTLEELAEVMTWYQIGYHAKPIALFNINQFYGKFMDLLEHMVSEGFLKEDYLTSVIVEENPEKLVNLMNEFESTTSDKWG